MRALVSLVALLGLLPGLDAKQTLPPIADIDPSASDVRFVPKADISL
jgi:hypothetical protein